MTLAGERFVALVEWVNATTPEAKRGFLESHPDYFPPAIRREALELVGATGAPIDPSQLPSEGGAFVSEAPQAQEETWRQSLAQLWSGITGAAVERDLLVMLGELESSATRNREIERARPSIDWQTGSIGRSYTYPFQRDVRDLLRERWRARICHNCGRPFIADKPPQKQCSKQCYVEFKSKWKKRDEEGTTDKRFRRVRSRKARKIRGKPKRVAA